MIGLYINSESPANLSINSLNLSYLCHDIEKIKSINLVYNNNKANIPQHYKDDSIEIYLVGTFHLGEKINDIVELARAIRNQGITSLYKTIEFGNFVAICRTIDDIYIITDPLSLRSHFYSLEKDFKISPTTLSFNTKADCLHSDLINKQGHTIGKYTGLSDVYRILPFQYISIKRSTIETVTDWTRLDYSIRTIFADIQKLKKSLSSSNICVALSSGFDSRLIASIFRPKYSYSWGPANSKDLRVAKKICSTLDIEIETFSLTVDHTRTDEEIHDYYCQNNCLQNRRITSGYRHAYTSITRKSDICLDGFLGDVFQRGTYFFGKGLGEEIRKLIPFLDLTATPQKLLRSRYSKVWNQKEFRKIVLKSYQDFLDTYRLDNTLGSVVAFDYLWGRGIRLIGTGGAGVNTYYNSVLTPLASPRIVTSLLYSSPKYFFRLQLFKEIWSMADAPNEIKKLLSEHYFSPSTSRRLIYAISFLGRLVLNYVPGMGNYGKE